MNCRERVMAAIRHEVPDRVPVDLMGHASGLLDPSYFRLRDYLGLEPIPPIGPGILQTTMMSGFWSTLASIFAG